MADEPAANHSFCSVAAPINSRSRAQRRDAHVKQRIRAARSAAFEVRQRLQLVVLRVPAAPALARHGHTRLEDYDGAYSDVRLPILHTHSGSSFRAFFDTSLQCGARCMDWIPNGTGIGKPRAQARDFKVADRVGEHRKVASVDEPATHGGTAR